MPSVSPGSPKGDQTVGAGFPEREVGQYLKGLPRPCLHPAGKLGKIEIFPLTLPSPARGEGKEIEIEIEKKLPPP
jgi:hypothetical protein